MRGFELTHDSPSTPLPAPLAGQHDADVFIGVMPFNHGQSMQSAIDIVNFYEPYDSELAQRTGWKLEVTLCKH